VTRKQGYYIFLLDLSLFLWCKVIDNIEELTNFLRSPALYHIRHSLAANIAGTRTTLRVIMNEGD
jgi:hypothetical protein